MSCTAVGPSALGCAGHRYPTPCGVGCILPPLRGCGGFLICCQRANADLAASSIVSRGVKEKSMPWYESPGFQQRL